MIELIEFKVIPYESRYRYTFKYTYNGENNQLNMISDNFDESLFYFYFKAKEFHRI